MDKINYLSNSTASQSGKYPVTIQGLEFVQKQILQLQKLAFVGGDYYILKPSSSENVGVCVINGEVLPLAGVKTATDTHIQITTTTETIRTDSGDYEDVREVRVARYGKHATGGATFKDATWTPLSTFAAFAPNTELLARINELTELLGENSFLPIKWGVYTLKALNSEKSPARIFCKMGSQAICGCTAYTIDVYVCGDGVIYQELKTQDLHRFGRYFNAITGVWGNFHPVDDQMQLEAKVVRGTLYLRHGFLPPYARIIVLRKKRRNKIAGRGRKHRSAKCAWFHGWKMVVSKGTPNKWYVPKCNQYKELKVAHYTKVTLATGLPVQYVPNYPQIPVAVYPYIGKDFSAAIDQLLYKAPTTKRKFWSISGVNKQWGTKTIRHAYARLALAVITSTSHDVPANSMLRLKYRVWDDRKTGTTKRGLSVE